MNVDARDPLTAAHELLDELLLGKMEYFDVLLCGHKKEGLGGVEGRHLGQLHVLSEGRNALPIG